MFFLEKLYDKNKQTCLSDILNFYEQNGYLIVNFLYFGTIISCKLLKEKKEDKFKYYEKSIKDSNFLLPDGIALRLLFKRKKGYGIYNLNGTDFVPYFLNNLGSKKVNLILYGAKKEDFSKLKRYVKEEFGVENIYINDGFKEFDYSILDELSDNCFNILLVGRGSPLQENWLYENKEIIKKYEILAFGVGGLFDFWSGNETRAPLYVRKLYLEWLRRFISNPKKNYKKFINSFHLIKFLLKN